MLKEVESLYGLREVKELHGSTVRALDGDVGRVDEFSITTTPPTPNRL